MMNIEIDALYLLLGANALLAGAAGVAIARFRTKVIDAAAFWSSPTGAAVQADSDGRERSGREIEARLDALAAALETLASRPVPEPAAPPPPAESRFENAVLLARQGAGVRDLTQCCGLNAGEAQLLVRLHGRRAPVDHAA